MDGTSRLMYWAMSCGQGEQSSNGSRGTSGAYFLDTEFLHCLLCCASRQPPCSMRPKTGLIHTNFNGFLLHVLALVGLSIAARYSHSEISYHVDRLDLGFKHISRTSASVIAGLTLQFDLLLRVGFCGSHSCNTFEDPGK